MIFNFKDQLFIEQIPLSMNNIWNNQMWLHDHNEIYTIKSSYKALHNIHTSAYPPVPSFFWKKMWRLQILPKTKNLIWSAAHNCLPNRNSLLQKNADVSSTCPIYGNAFESMIHIFVEHIFAKQVWHRSSIGYIRGMASTFQDSLDMVFNRQSMDNCAFISMICWGYQNNRNNIVCNGRFQITNRKIYHVSHYLQQ